MKKLMIAAAAAALIGSASADDAVKFVYDFSASLRTTRGIAGAVTDVTVVNLGYKMDGDNMKFWYDDDCVDKNAGTITLPKADVDGAAADVVINNAVTGPDINGYHLNLAAFNLVKVDPADEKSAYRPANVLKKAFAKQVEGVYLNRSMGVYCATFSYVETEANCYRIAGAKVIGAELVAENCCSEGWKNGADVAIDTTAGLGKLIYFGGLTRARANQVEMYAEIKNVEGFEGWLAGQGTLANLVFNDAGYWTKNVNMISGNIVGKLPNSKCEFCCSTPISTLAFECNTNDDGLTTLSTAAFGTFTLRYNVLKTRAANRVN